MQKLYLFLCVAACIIFGSCSFTKWDNYEELVGEWESPYEFCKGSKFIFNEDGTCQVIDIPANKMYFNEPHTTLIWDGNEQFKEKFCNIEKWNFSGYWVVEEDTTYDSFTKPYYRYNIRMSPYREMLRTKHERDSFMNNTNVEDAFWIKIMTWTQSPFPPARLQYLYFYVLDPDDDYTFHKKKDK